jgi:hypothetical protein
MRTLVPTSPRRARALRAITLALLLLGYTDLARGGMIAAPVLLVSSYMLLVPLAILLD